MNLTGNVNLLKLEKAGIATIKNKKCVVIPIEENDLYVSMDENLKAKAVYLNVNINESRANTAIPITANNTYQSSIRMRTRQKQKPSQRFTWETSSLMSLRVPGMPQLRWKRLLCRLMMIHSHFRI
mgnify:CR=1 FL=1